MPFQIVINPPTRTVEILSRRRCEAAFWKNHQLIANGAGGRPAVDGTARCCKNSAKSNPPGLSHKKSSGKYHTNEHSKMKIQFQTGLSRLWVACATIWLTISSSCCHQHVDALVTTFAGDEEDLIKFSETIIPFGHRRLDDYYGDYYDDGDNETSWGGVSLVMIGAMLFGILVCTYAMAYFMLGPLAKEYKTQGKHIVGLVTGAKKKVRQDFHGSATPGLFYGSYINGTTTETTTNRILDVEYPVVVDGERKIVRKIFRYLHKKTFDRPSETGEVELYILRERGIFSAYPRDEFHLSAADKCKETSLGICCFIMFVVLLVLGGFVKTPWYLFLAVFAMDIAIAYGLCVMARNCMLKRGKVLRFVPGEAGERAFNFDVYDHDETSGEEFHHDKEDGYHHREAEVLKSAPPAPREQAGIPFATAVESGPIANGEETPPPKPTSQKKKKKKNPSNSGTHSPCQSPKKSNKNTAKDFAVALPSPTKPVPIDVCFGAESHPGTIAWRKAVKEVMDDFADDEFGPPVHLAIKKRLKDCHFWIEAKHGEQEWKVASKGEVVRQFRDAFDTEQALFFQTSVRLSSAPMDASV